jgi:nucleoside-diphosphate kinase
MRRKLGHHIVRRYAAAGLVLMKKDTLTLTHEQVVEFYEEHRGREYFGGLVAGMTSGPVTALVLVGEDAIATVRALNGPTRGNEGRSGQIRFDYYDPEASSLNVVHASDGTASFEREYAIIWPRKRLSH